MDGSNKQRLRVLLSAYSCEPVYSSERGVGWNWALQISKYYDIWVLTRLSNKKLIEREIQKKYHSNLHFLYFDLPKWMCFWKKGERGLYPYYTLWQIGALLFSLKMHKKIRFDITHYLTFGSILLPTFIFLMPTKFIFGPIGGGGNAPLKFFGEFSLKGKLNEIIRHIVQKVYAFNPLLYMQAAKADKILVRDKETLMMIPSLFRNKAVIFLETGVPAELLNYKKRLKHNRQETGIKIITVGRFIHSKISILTLKAIKIFKENYKLPFKLYIVGDGKEKNNLIEFCRRNDICKDVIFTGWLPREKVFQLLTESDIYLSTSFKEGGSWAIFEAIMMELPTISLKCGGPDIIICDDCGIKVNVGEPSQVTEELSEGLHLLAEDSTLRKKLAFRAKGFLLRNYTWNEIGKNIDKIYEEVI